MGRADLKAKIRLEGDASGANRAIKSTEKGFKGLTGKLKTGALAIVGALASVTGALKLLESAGERLGQKRSLERTLESQGDSIDELVPKLRSLANNQIATSDIILASNRALALGISKDDLPGLLEAATKASVALGISATQAFNDITTGVGRASPLILDNLGIVVDAVKIYADLAESLGVATEELTKQQKTAALSKAVMENASKGAEDFATAQSAVTVALAKSKTALKEWFETTIDAIAQNDTLADSINGVSEGLKNYAAAIRAVRIAQEEQNESGREFTDVAGRSRNQLELLLKPILFLNKGLQELGKNQREVEATQAELAENTAKLTARYEAQGVQMLKALGFLESYSDAQEKANNRTLRIEASIAKETSALSLLAAALGEVTQAELEKELLDIQDALEKARQSTDASSDAFVRYERIANEKIDLLKTNIRRLVDGLDVLGETTEDTGDSFDDLTGSVDDTNAALSRQATQARATASDLRALTGVAGSLALAEARTALAITQAERRRVTGVSSQQDPNRGSITGLPVGPVGTFIVQPDGTLVPA